MKSKFGLIHFFSITAIGLIVSVSAFAQNSCVGGVANKGAEMNSREIRVAFPYANSITRFNPQVINVNSEANLARNLYSRLVEYDRDGKIEPSLASDIYVENGKVVLEIRQDVKTVDGQVVGAADVLFTLNNIVKGDKNTHGSLKSLLEIREGDRVEDFIWRDGETVYIRPRRSTNTEFVVPILASTDYSIVPNQSRKADGIKDYRNTSGVYYIREDAADGSLLLAANPNHYYYSKNIPQLIRLVPETGDKALQSFEDGKIDFIVTINGGKPSRYKEVSAKVDKSVIRQTEGIQLTVLKTTVAGRERFTADELVYIGQKIKEVLLKKEAYLDGGELTAQFFPHLGEGRLSESQSRELADRLKRVLTGSGPQGKVFKLAVGPHEYETRKSDFAHLPYIEVVSSKVVPWALPRNESPDGYVVRTDSSFYESLSLISYSFATGTFGRKSDGETWVSDYMSISDKAQRVLKLQDLHYQVLMDGYVTPIMFNSYMTLTRDPLQFEISRFYAGTKFWKLKIP